MHGRPALAQHVPLTISLCCAKSPKPLPRTQEVAKVGHSRRRQCVLRSRALCSGTASACAAVRTFRSRYCSAATCRDLRRHEAPGHVAVASSCQVTVRRPGR